MKQVIKEIINIEHKAKDIISTTNEEIARRRSETEAKLEQMHAKIIKDTKEKIDFLKERDTEAEILDVGDDYEEQLADMEAKAEKNMKAWSNKLYKMVLGESDE